MSIIDGREAVKIMDDAVTTIKKIKQENRDMRNILYDIEWNEHLNKADKFCPYCGEYVSKGHDVTCELNKVLHET